MQLYPKRKSDAEYVAAVRKAVRRSKWIAVFNVCMFAVLVVFFFIFWRFIFSLQDMWPDLAEEIGKGVYIGIMLGMFAGFLLSFALLNLVFGLLRIGDRTAHLMLKFYDELRKKESAVQPADGADAVSPPAGEQVGEKRSE